MRSVLVYILMLSAAGQAYAVRLPEIPAPTAKTLPISRDEGNIPCDQLVNRLITYNQMARQHDQSVTAFLGEVTTKVNGWYDLLKPLEGKTQRIESGTFEPLKTGSEQISKITDLAFDNTELLAIELDRIIVSLRACSQSRP